MRYDDSRNVVIVFVYCERVGIYAPHDIAYAAHFTVKIRIYIIITLENYEIYDCLEMENI